MVESKRNGPYSKDDVAIFLNSLDPQEKRSLEQLVQRAGGANKLSTALETMYGTEIIAPVSESRIQEPKEQKTKLNKSDRYRIKQYNRLLGRLYKTISNHYSRLIRKARESLENFQDLPYQISSFIQTQDPEFQAESHMTRSLITICTGEPKIGSFLESEEGLISVSRVAKNIVYSYNHGEISDDEKRKRSTVDAHRYFGPNKISELEENFPLNKLVAHPSPGIMKSLIKITLLANSVKDEDTKLCKQFLEELRIWRKAGRTWKIFDQPARSVDLVYDYGTEPARFWIETQRLPGRFHYWRHVVPDLKKKYVKLLMEERKEEQNKEEKEPKLERS